MQFRTDLAMECVLETQDTKAQGVQLEKTEKSGLTVHTLKVDNDNAARTIGKPQGVYVTVETGDFKSPQSDFCNEIDAISSILSDLLPKKHKNVLVVGLGNEDITPDALGPLAIKLIFVTRHIGSELQREIGIEGLMPVSAIAPGVLGQTGMESAEIVKALVSKLSPDCVIVIDALASRDINRLASTVQLSTAGISPGSGVLNMRKELSFATLNVPVISIGVPMVVDMGTIVYDLAGQVEHERLTKVNPSASTMMVTPREIDNAVSNAARTVAFAINKALQPNLTTDELTALVS